MAIAKRGSKDKGTCLGQPRPKSKLDFQITRQLYHQLSFPMDERLKQLTLVSVQIHGFVCVSIFTTKISFLTTIHSLPF